MTWGTPVQSFVFLGLLVFELEPMYATSDGQATDADDRLMPPPPLQGRGHNNNTQIYKAPWLQRHGGRSLMGVNQNLTEEVHFKPRFKYSESTLIIVSCRITNS